MKRLLSRIAQGLGIGTAPLVPGVSAATIALIMGVYEKLIAELAGFLRVPKRASDLRENLTRDWNLLLPTGLGIVIAIGIGATFIPRLVETQPLAVFSVFSGLIAASAVVLARQLHGPRSGYLWLVLGAILGVAAASAPVTIDAQPTVLGVVIAGMLAVAAMLLPGVSGSYVLLLLGYYTNVLEALRTLDIRFLMLFGAGGVLGAALSIVGIRKLLERFHLQTMLVLVGIIAGALGKPLSIALDAVRTGTDWFVFAGFAILGIVLTIIIHKRS